MTNKLRLAIITNVNNYYAWQDVIVNKLRDQCNIEILLHLSYNKENSNSKSDPFFWKFFKRIDSKIFNPHPFALQTVSNTKFQDDFIETNYLKNDESFDISSYKIDVVLNFSHISRPKINLNQVTHGMWFITPCDLNEVNKKPYGIWELINKRSENIAVLRCITKDDISPSTIAVTSSCSDLLSYKRNINSLMWQASLLFIHNIKLLASNESLFIKKLLANDSLYSDKALEPDEFLPSNGLIISYALKLYYNKIKQLINSTFFFNQWALIYRNNKDRNFSFDFSTYKPILPPKDRFWADPFLLKRNGKFYLFIEELIYKNKLGHLSVMEIDENGNYSKPKAIMVKDYHLSYPFIFEDQGELYMIPETSGNKDIQLYKCIDFPLKWDLEKVLMYDVIAVDTTIHKLNDTYWMFTNLKKHEGAAKHVELYAFSTDNLISGHWIEHPLNPVVTDIKTSRPAGSIFEENNKLYRPSQDCSNFYGYGLNIMEITQLSNSEYEEKLHYKIEPNWNKSIISTHTFNGLDTMEIGDIKIKRRRFF